MDFSAVKDHGPDGATIREFIGRWLIALSPELRTLFGETIVQVVSVNNHFQRHHAAKLHTTRVVNEAELSAIVENFTLWSQANEFRGRRIALSGPKSPQDEAADFALRTVKKIMVAGVGEILQANLEIQCRYQTRRVVVVNRLDPKYDRTKPGAPKSTVLGGLDKATGQCFMELGALNQHCQTVLTGQTVEEMVQEANALLR